MYIVLLYLRALTFSKIKGSEAISSPLRLGNSGSLGRFPGWAQHWWGGGRLRVEEWGWDPLPAPFCRVFSPSWLPWGPAGLQRGPALPSRGELPEPAASAPAPGSCSPGGEFMGPGLCRTGMSPPQSPAGLNPGAAASPSLSPAEQERGGSSGMDVGPRGREITAPSGQD